MGSEDAPQGRRTRGDSGRRDSDAAARPALVPPPRRPLLAYHGLLAPRSGWRAGIVPKPSNAARRGAAASAPRRWPWARLLHRVFAIQVLVCDRCGGPRRILGAVTEPHAVQRVLGALRLAAEPPPRDAGPAA